MPIEGLNRIIGVPPIKKEQDQTALKRKKEKKDSKKERKNADKQKKEKKGRVDIRI
jgi:hypothetical protein